MTNRRTSEFESGPWTPASVEWDSDRRMAVVSRDGQTIALAPGEAVRLAFDILNVAEPHRDPYGD